MTHDYRPHLADRAACIDALDAYIGGLLWLTDEEVDALHATAAAVDAGALIGQHTICRAHDAIDRHRRGN